MVTEETREIVEQHLQDIQDQHIQNEVTRRRRNIDSFVNDMNSSNQRIAENLRQIRSEQELLDIALTASEKNNFAEHLISEWLQLCEHPRLVNAELINNCLILTTTDDLRLHRADSPETRWLGAFRITISIADNHIELRNLSTKRGGRDHPHVVDGGPCFGSDHGSFTQLLANGDLFVLFEMLLQYLETLNLNDEYGRYGAYWFEAPDERPEVEVDVA